MEQIQAELVDMTNKLELFQTKLGVVKRDKKQLENEIEELKAVKRVIEELIEIERCYRGINRVKKQNRGIERG
jgi:chaperonin cofactor prefoldin